MNPQMPTATQLETSTYVDSEARETDLLASWGFDPHEVASLRLPTAVVPERRQ